MTIKALDTGKVLHVVELQDALERYMPMSLDDEYQEAQAAWQTASEAHQALGVKLAELTARRDRLSSVVHLRDTVILPMAGRCAHVEAVAWLYYTAITSAVDGSPMDVGDILFCGECNHAYELTGRTGALGLAALDWSSLTEEQRRVFEKVAGK